MRKEEKRDKAVRFEMVEIDHNRFAAEILKGNARVNLTAMAKPFGTKPADWLRTEEAKRYIKALAVSQKCETDDLVEVQQGGKAELQGTWCNDYHIAIRFAQWLSPDLSIAVDDVLIRLMFGEAVMAEAINGVEPVVYEGRLWYNYRDVRQSFGLSRKSSASKRKKAAPQCFKKLYGQNFISREYVEALQAYHKWKECSRQLSLPFGDVGKVK